MALFPLQFNVGTQETLGNRMKVVHAEEMTQRGPTGREKHDLDVPQGCATLHPGLFSHLPYQPVVNVQMSRNTSLRG